MSSYLGQNFLIDKIIVKSIVSAIENALSFSASQILLEIGPGKGALTKEILFSAKTLLCIEKDTTMQDYLDVLIKKNSAMSVVYQDVLQFSDSELRNNNVFVVGNLPYYITSPILRKFFGSVSIDYAGGIFLIQKEVADKIVYNASKKSFLRWLINYAYCVEYCFSVPPEAFNPPPKVTSAVIRLVPKKHTDIPSLSYQTLLIFLDRYSPFKRKTLASSHKIVNKLLKKESSDTIFFDVSPFASKRIEELTWDDMHIIVTSACSMSFK